MMILANLAAILTSDIKFGRVETLTDIVERGQRLCATRKVVDQITAVHNLDESFFVVDPTEEGGDGLPGFACENCAPRRRIFDFLDPDLAKLEKSGPNAKYCHAALAVVEDLDLFQSEGVHCNKSFVGSVLSDSYWGVPMYSGVSTSLTTLMLALKNQAVLNAIMFNQRPKDQCIGLTITAASETSSLNITQLSGIWVVSGGFAVIALLITFLAPYCKDRKRRRKGTHVHVLSRYDQMGQRISRDQDGMGALEETLHLDKDRLEYSRHSQSSDSGDGGGFGRRTLRRKRKHREMRNSISSLGGPPESASNPTSGDARSSRRGSRRSLRSSFSFGNSTRGDRRSADV